MAKRRKGRILAFQALYSWEAQFQKAAVSETLLDFPWLEPEQQERLDESTKAFSRLLITGTIENIASVDTMIRSLLENREFSRVNRVDLALLRMSAYTLMYQRDVPVSIVISEAIAISQDYGDRDSYRFINGVLDALYKTIHTTAATAGEV
jgi:N utilization substance protein B